MDSETDSAATGTVVAAATMTAWSRDPFASPSASDSNGLWSWPSTLRRQSASGSMLPLLAATLFLLLCLAGIMHTSGGHWDDRTATVASGRMALAAASVRVTLAAKAAAASSSVIGQGDDGAASASSSSESDSCGGGRIAPSVIRRLHINRAALSLTVDQHNNSQPSHPPDSSSAPLSWLIGGVQKGGTTALFEHLRLHPQLHTATTKEAHVFDDERFDWTRSRTPEDAYRKLHNMFTTTNKDKQTQGQTEKQVKTEGGELETPAAAADQLHRGEATPIYLFWPPSMERIARYRPDIRMILVFRDPVSRAFSHWRMETARRLESRPFSVAIREGARRWLHSHPQAFSHIPAHQLDQMLQMHQDAPLNNNTTARATTQAAAESSSSFSSSSYLPDRVTSYVERGLYGSQLRRALEWLPRSQLLLLRSEDLQQSPADALQRVCAFLGVDPPGPEVVAPRLENVATTATRTLPRTRAAVGPAPTTNSTNSSGGSLASSSSASRSGSGSPSAVPEMSEEDKALLQLLYASDLRDFTQCSGLDTSKWAPSQIHAHT